MKPSWYTRRIIVASTAEDHEAITYVQRVLRCKETGELDDETRSHVRGFQTLFALKPNGIIDDATAEQINHVWPEGA